MHAERSDRPDGGLPAVSCASGGDPADARWSVEGKFLRCGSARIHPRIVTYGPFPGGWPEDLLPDFRRIKAAGFDAIRLYEIPGRPLLDAAQASGLKVMGTLMWEQNGDFMAKPGRLSAAMVLLERQLQAVAEHPALAAVYVGNEIPADLVRWMGPQAVQRAVESLIALGREVAPQLLFAYANYPSTEYLEPGNADFTAFNIYLEDPVAYRAYLKRLHHVAGDRPLLVSEFGIDSRRNGLERQAGTLRWAAAIAHEEEAAGFTAYAWSDRWLSAGDEVLDWDFGLTDREGRDKPALKALAELRIEPLALSHTYSVIVCTRNGAARIGACLHAIARVRGALETIVVDDGSTDGTADRVAREFPWVRLLRLAPCGLSAARNAGAEAARGEVLAFTDDDCLPDPEWLLRLDRIFRQQRHAAVGGPNLPQVPKSRLEAVICAAPGAPSHVMLDDECAEHLPGCNLAARKSVWQAVGGFDPQFQTAGDDVDFCWRLQDAGHLLGFAPGAFVWHLRRPTARGFLHQQCGYGKAERRLIAKHPSRFTRCGDARWKGFVYAGGPIRLGDGAVIYHGEMGMAGYQAVTHHMQPLRDIDPRFKDWRAEAALALLRTLASIIRTWQRARRLCPPGHNAASATEAWAGTVEELDCGNVPRQSVLEALRRDGWRACDPSSSWDLEKQDSRVLVATELGRHQQLRTLIRIDGRSKFLPEDIIVRRS